MSNPPKEFDDSSLHLSEELERLNKAIQELEKAIKDRGTKDRWDKAGVIGQIFSGVVLGILGLGATIIINRGQERIQQAISNAQITAQKQQEQSQEEFAQRQQKDQLKRSEDEAASQQKLENQKQASDYLGKIIAASNEEGQAKLISNLDIALPPDDAVRIAIRYAHPNKGPSENQVTTAATLVLKRLKDTGRTELERIRALRQIPESEIAADVLGQPTKFLVRVSEVDDFGDVSLNGNRILPTVTNGRDTGWIDLTKRLARGSTNNVDLEIANSPYEGCGGRFRISSGAQQYDYRVYLRSCPPNRKDIWIDFALNVDHAGKIQFLNHDVHYICPTDPKTFCVTGCQSPPKQCEE